ncbi:MAG: serine/threonine-protein kinase [Proteobacteria bacterium]|nr:serine/threonine-protein kinase [Pseudomonadota bacterium]
MHNHQSVFCPKCQKPCPARAGFCPSCGTQIGHSGAADDDPYLGNTIDNTFVVESILGAGSMGIVYRARHRAMNSYVALKVLRHDFLSNRVVLTRFQREAQAASCLSHPNVIRILHYGKTFLKAPYIAMECLEGQDLSDLVVREFPLAQRRVAGILLQVTSALEAAHAAGIIHRDLKPANIIVMPRPGGEELVKVLDFGIAKIIDIEGEGLTREGAICGTPAFMSPEQVLGKAVTPASDLFSLGSILYFMLTCKLPFQGASMVDMATSILSTSPPPPSRARLDACVDPHLERICVQALEKDPTRRFPSALAMKEAILAALPNISEPMGNVRKTIVVGDAPPDLALDEATCCDVPAYQSIQGDQGWSDVCDDLEDKTALQVPAMHSEERPALMSGAVSAVGAAVSHVLSVVAPVVPPPLPRGSFRRREHDCSGVIAVF